MLYLPPSRHLTLNVTGPSRIPCVGNPIFESDDDENYDIFDFFSEYTVEAFSRPDSESDVYLVDDACNIQITSIQSHTKVGGMDVRWLEEEPVCLI